ncbi:MAG: hypothetical protein A3K09_03990 [Nitrospinae bacterium RIFCSPLOWO2_12_FULL_47_7]|nr:MAG: hypothetical protein A3K09_03990 [Nitrospinae bacterium RIFCSPLOWO2_12_FULL_47_7]
MLTTIKHRFRTFFIAGLLITLPIAFTFFILSFLFKGLDNSLSPLFTELLIFLGAPVAKDFQIPGVGVFMTLVIIFFVGVLATNIFGEKLVHWGESIVARIPVVRSIYTGVKQVVTTIIQTDANAFSKCVLVEFPRKGVYALGFITSEAKGEIQMKTEEQVCNVFVPTTPNPTSGFLIFIPQNELIDMEMSIEDGLKLIISGGIVVPPFDPAKAARIENGRPTKDIKI